MVLPWGFWLLLRLSLMVPQSSGLAYHFLPQSSRPAVLTCSYSEWIRLLLTPQSLHYIYSKWHLPPFYLLHHTAWAEATILYHLTYFQSLLTSLLSQLSLRLGAQELFLNDKEVARIHRRTVQKDLYDPDNHDGVITHLEPGVLECEIKWALGSITTNKASGGDGIPVELFQILKDDALKVLHSICQQIWKTQQWPQDWKRSVFIPIPKKGNAKEYSNYRTIVLISHASKVMLKILQARLQ